VHRHIFTLEELNDVGSRVIQFGVLDKVSALSTMFNKTSPAKMIQQTSITMNVLTQFGALQEIVGGWRGGHLDESIHTIAHLAGW
jgi:hypothetical protein